MAVTLKESLKNVKKHSDAINSLIINRRQQRLSKKFYSQSVSPVKTLAYPEFKAYEKVHTKLPKIHKKAKKDLKTRRLSMDPSESSSFMNFESIESTKFFNAIERLKLLIK